MNDEIKNIDDASFEAEVLRSPVPVLVDYWAAWCTPCKMIAPLLDESAATYAGRLRVAKIDIDDNPRVPYEYRVRSIPTLMLFKDGQVVATQVGAVSKAQLAAFIESNVNAGVAERRA